MIIDVHTHIFPDDVRSDRARFFKGEPAFELLYAPEKSKMVSADEMVAMMDDQGVDRAVVFGFPWNDPDLVRKHNDYVARGVARHPDRLIGLGCLDPFAPNAREEAQECLASGLSGFGELAFYRSGIDEAARTALSPIMALAAEKDLPVMVHTNEPVGHDYPGKSPVTVRQILALLEAFPDNRIILAHWGGGVFFYHLMKKGVKPILENAWFDTAASPYLYDPAIYRTAVDILGPEKILFGSDYPLIPPSRYMKDMEKGGLTDAERDAVCGENTRSLFHLD